MSVLSIKMYHYISASYPRNPQPYTITRQGRISNRLYLSCTTHNIINNVYGLRPHTIVLLAQYLTLRLQCQGTTTTSPTQ